MGIENELFKTLELSNSKFYFGLLIVAPIKIKLKMIKSL